MRIDRISLKNYPPIKAFEAETLSNVVIIAGANGSGKTRLKEAIVKAFRLTGRGGTPPEGQSAGLKISATSDEEKEAWEKSSFEVTPGQPCPILRKHLLSQISSQEYTGAIIQIESDRTVQTVNIPPLNLSAPDPDDKKISRSDGLNPFKDKWEGFIKDIHNKEVIRNRKITRFIEENLKETGEYALSKFPNPLLLYEKIFNRLLPGKTLARISTDNPRDLYYCDKDSELMPINNLSSGEQEIVRVTFNLISKNITHSVILIDEPELHLHPTLASNLIETLKDLGGKTNQLILFTHSADLISTYYSSGCVFFIDKQRETGNQARRLSDIRDSHSAIAHTVAANLGIFAVSKRLVFVEGKDTSVDRPVYHKIAQSAFPGANISPIGSVNNINALREVVDELTKTIFGVELFLIRDRDRLSDVDIKTLEKNTRFRCLLRPHIENYLLDSEVLVKVAERFCLSTEMQDISTIEENLKTIASSTINHVILQNVQNHINSLFVKEPEEKIKIIDEISQKDLANKIYKQIENKFSGNLRELQQKLDRENIRHLVSKEHSNFKVAIFLAY